ncbi:unnamed protein product, partial [Didymodactylos carnosus]
DKDTLESLTIFDKYVKAKYVHIKLIERFYDDKNIDLERVACIGYLNEESAPKKFEKLERLPQSFNLHRKILQTFNPLHEDFEEILSENTHFFVRTNDQDVKNTVQKIAEENNQSLEKSINDKTLYAIIDMDEEEKYVLTDNNSDEILLLKHVSYVSIYFDILNKIAQHVKNLHIVIFDCIKNDSHKKWFPTTSSDDNDLFYFSKNKNDDGDYPKLYDEDKIYWLLLKSVLNFIKKSTQLNEIKSN